MEELIDRKSCGWPEVARIALPAITALALGGCITFLAASNVDLANMIQEKYEDMESAATANGYDVAAALAAPEAQGEGSVNSLLNEAHVIAENAALTAERSLRIDAANETQINEGALQQMALDGFSDDLQEFQQSAAWLALEANKLVAVDQKILALSGYTECGGSTTGDVICSVDIASKTASIFSMAGFGIPGMQALGFFAAGMAIGAEVVKAVKRGEYFGERERRITAIQYVANQNLLPAFSNLKGNMTSALMGLSANLRPPGWEDALTDAEADVNQVVTYMNGLDGLFDVYKREAEETHELLIIDITPEEMSEITGKPASIYMDPEEVAFERIWAELAAQLSHLESAMTGLRDVKTNLQQMREANRSGAAMTVNDKGEQVLEYKTTLLRNDNDTLIEKLARIEELEWELNNQLSLSSEGISCPLPL